MNKIKVREIIEVPWLILNCGFWATLATFRGFKTRYLAWRINKLELDDSRLKSSIDERQKPVRKVKKGHNEC